MTKEIDISENNLIELMTYWSDVAQYRDKIRKHTRKIEELMSLTTAARTRFWARVEELYPETASYNTKFEEDEGKLILMYKENVIKDLLKGVE